MDMMPIDMIVEALSINGRAATNNLDVIIGWCNKPHQDVVFDPSYYHTTEDGYNPDNIFMSYAGMQECCNYYRDSLKPYLKEMCTDIKDHERRIAAMEGQSTASTLDLSNYPTIDEVNEALQTHDDTMQSHEQRIAALEAENRSMKATIDMLLKRIEALGQK